MRGSALGIGGNMGFWHPEDTSTTLSLTATSFPYYSGARPSLFEPNLNVKLKEKSVNFKML